MNSLSKSLSARISPPLELEASQPGHHKNFPNNPVSRSPSSPSADGLLGERDGQAPGAAIAAGLKSLCENPALSLLGGGWPGPAFSSAGAGRVKGFLPSCVLTGDSERQPENR
jgi:hypothetical protein